MAVGRWPLAAFDPLTRFIAKVKVNQKTGCWEWQAYISPRGYGEFGVNGTPKPAYKVAYEWFVGKVPEGLYLDHLCRNRACVNPAHLEPVTNAENIRRGFAARHGAVRKTHCKKGHPLEGDNLHVRSSGKSAGVRVCVTCSREATSKYRGRKQAAASLSPLTQAATAPTER